MMRGRKSEEEGGGRMRETDGRGRTWHVRRKDKGEKMWDK